MSARPWLTSNLFFVAMLLALPAGAMDFTVSRGDDPVPNGCLPADCSLREAVITSNVLAGADRIILPAGLYQLTIGGNADDDAAIGDLDVHGSLVIEGAGVGTTAVLAENTSRIFEVQDNADLTLRGLEIDGGRATAGGAIQVRTLGRLQVENSMFAGNQATADGGALQNQSNDAIVLRHVTLSDNAAGGNGGAIEAGFGGVVAIDTLIEDNQAVNGAGIFGEAITVRRSTIRNNTASADGGGLHAKPGCSCSFLNLDASTLSGNNAVHGGGAYLTYPFFVDRSTISGNSASASGGGLYIDDTTGGGGGDRADIYSSTLYLNTAPDASALLFHDVAGTIEPVPTLRNTLLSGTCAHDGSGSHALYGLLGNVESPGNTCNLDATFSKPATAAADIKLGALTDNGGPTQTHLPQAGSMLIDGAWKYVCESIDQRGFVRADAFCDVGAVEAGALDDVIFRHEFEL